MPRLVWSDHHNAPHKVKARPGLLFTMNKAYFAAEGLDQGGVDP